MNLAPYKPPPRFNQSAKLIVVMPLLFGALMLSPWYYACGVTICVMWNKLGR